MIENPIYLGDALHATFDDFHVILTTEHHEPAEANNVVYVDLERMEKLIKWYRECKPE